jgi:hypothetical protein
VGARLVRTVKPVTIVELRGRLPFVEPPDHDLEIEYAVQEPVNEAVEVVQFMMEAVLFVGRLSRPA